MKIIKSWFLFLGVFLGISLFGWAKHSIVTVPAPSGGDDTLVVQAALDQCVLQGRGCTVQLAAGMYKTTQLFAEDFHGTFKGMGMDVTVIQALPLQGNTTQPQPNAILPSLDNPYPN